MTAQEMLVAFKQGLDKFDSLNYPNFEEDQIEFLLNQAQDAFVKQRYGATNTKKQSFEETQKRTEDLKNIVVNAILTPLANTTENINQYSRFVVLPDGTFPVGNPYAKHWFIIQELTDVSYTDCKGDIQTEKVYTRAIQHNDYSKLINNPFGKPKRDKVLRLMENGKVELIPHPSVTINSYHLRYIKEPVRISIVNNVDCELSEHTHQEIVNNAIIIGLEGIESRRTGTFEQLILNKEE